VAHSLTSSKVEHFGITGMSERVKLLGGILTISSEPGAGTSVVACLPLDEGRGKR
jgi:signal transduction histidine kinase